MVAHLAQVNASRADFANVLSQPVDTLRKVDRPVGG
jgi:hypothetical protein